MKDLFKNSSPKKCGGPPVQKNISNAMATKFFPVNSFLFGDLQCNV